MREKQERKQREKRETAAHEASSRPRRARRIHGAGDHGKQYGGGRGEPAVVPPPEPSGFPGMGATRRGGFPKNVGGGNGGAPTTMKQATHGRRAPLERPGRIAQPLAAIEELAPSRRRGARGLAAAGNDAGGGGGGGDPSGGGFDISERGLCGSRRSSARRTATASGRCRATATATPIERASPPRVAASFLQQEAERRQGEGEDRGGDRVDAAGRRSSRRSSARWRSSSPASAPSPPRRSSRARRARRARRRAAAARPAAERVADQLAVLAPARSSWNRRRRRR